LFHLNEAYFAEHLESGEIKYDYIGLKGDVADFTKQILTTRPQDIEFIESNDANMLRIFP
jgi:glutaredoxin-related protein